MSKSTEEPSLRSKVMNATWTNEGGSRLHTALTIEQLDQIMRLFDQELAKRVEEIERRAFEAGYSCGYDWVLSYNPQAAWDEYVGATLNNQTSANLETSGRNSEALEPTGRKESK